MLARTRKQPRSRPGWALAGLIVLVSIACISSRYTHRASPPPPPEILIVEGRDLASAAGAVRDVGGRIVHELGIIDAVAAELTPAQIAQLRGRKDISRIHQNRSIKVAGGILETFYPSMIGA